MKNLISLLIIVSFFFSCEKNETLNLDITGRWHHELLDSNIFSISNIYFIENQDSLTGQAYRYVFSDSTGTKVDTSVSLYVDINEAKREGNKIKFSWFENGNYSKDTLNYINYKYVFEGTINSDFNKMNGTYYIEKTNTVGNWIAYKF